MTTAAKRNAAWFRACRTGKVLDIAAAIADGMDPNATDADGLSGLIWAARKGQAESVRALLAHGAALEGVDRRGRTALFHAAVFNRSDVVRLLAAAGAGVNPVDCHGCTPLDIALMEYPRPGEVVAVLRALGAVARRYPPSAYTETPLPGDTADASKGGPVQEP